MQVQELKEKNTYIYLFICLFNGGHLFTYRSFHVGEELTIALQKARYPFCDIGFAIFQPSTISPPKGGGRMPRLQPLTHNPINPWAIGMPTISHQPLTIINPWSRSVPHQVSKMGEGCHGFA